MGTESGRLRNPVTAKNAQPRHASSSPRAAWYAASAELVIGIIVSSAYGAATAARTWDASRSRGVGIVGARF